MHGRFSCRALNASEVIRKRMSALTCEKWKQALTAHKMTQKMHRVKETGLCGGCRGLNSVVHCSAACPLQAVRKWGWGTPYLRFTPAMFWHQQCKYGITLLLLCALKCLSNFVWCTMIIVWTNIICSYIMYL